MQAKKTIKQTAIIGDDSRKSMGSGIIRGAIGGILTGGIGLLAGGLSAKNKKSTTFLVVYTDGTQETQTVKNNSYEYKNLCKYLKI